MFMCTLCHLHLANDSHIESSLRAPNPPDSSLAAHVSSEGCPSSSTSRPLLTLRCSVDRCPFICTALKVPTGTVNGRGKSRRVARSCTRYIVVRVLWQLWLLPCDGATGTGKLYFALLDYAPIPIRTLLYPTAKRKRSHLGKIE